MPVVQTSVCTLSILIDILLNDAYPVMTDIKGSDGWYITKPLNHCIPFYTLGQRLKDAWRILRGYGIAIHYKEDELMRKR